MSFYERIATNDRAIPITMRASVMQTRVCHENHVTVHSLYYPVRTCVLSSDDPVDHEKFIAQSIALDLNLLPGASAQEERREQHYHFT